MIHNTLMRMKPKLSRHLSVACRIVYATFLVVCSYFGALLYRRKELWLFRERGDDARDNAYWMFRYVKEQHPEIESYYAITKNSPDRARLRPWADSVIDQNSFAHYIYMWRATHMLSTHICGGYPNVVRGTKWLYHLVTWLSPKKTIWLQHGVILNDVGVRACRYNNVDMIVCSTRSEYAYLTQQCGFANNVVKLTGLARWDQLHDCEVKRNQILLMPTWRKWLSADNFAESEYFRTVADLLLMPQLHSFLEANAMTLIFYPHHEVQKHIHHFRALTLPTCIVIADKAEYDVQQLLKESALLITDYSSVSMDFAYMKKPIIYYLFDEEHFRKRHYASSDFDYHKAYGPTATNFTELLTALTHTLKRGTRMEDKFANKVDATFPFMDTQNCLRTIEGVKGL